MSVDTVAAQESILRALPGGIAVKAGGKGDEEESLEMVKLVFCCRRRPGMTLAQFQERWLEVHGPLVKRLRAQLPMMRRYVQSHTIPGEPTEQVRASRGAGEPYDGIAEVWLDGLEALQPGDAAALDAARQLFEDEARMIDFPRSAVFLTREHEIF